ncbi:ABC transporter ATP-binding protein [Olsenella massiliensis]|uniref:ABC transporter ATP-binding protein n=1 Tax=Olsenella massiliensis TaxID=1622075 RepID=UPI0009EB0F26|nr:ABC transporter ATP-binding protein [Olsenella massiliensis]
MTGEVSKGRTSRDVPAGPSAGFLCVRGLSKGYGQGDAHAQVLDGIAVDVLRGEVCVLFGPSGSGKSTFLNLLGGLERADAGSIDVAGQDICRLSSRELLEYRRRELGFVFQFYNLVPDLTMRENIEVNAHIADDPLDIDELLRKLGLWEHRGKFPNQVSGGQQQRCAIGRALVKKPGLLLCDEPTGALDYKTSKEILELMERVNQDYGTTMVIVTHNEAIRLMSHHILHLRDGRIASDRRNDRLVPAADLEW